MSFKKLAENSQSRSTGILVKKSTNISKRKPEGAIFRTWYCWEIFIDLSLNLIFLRVRYELKISKEENNSSSQRHTCSRDIVVTETLWIRPRIDFSPMILNWTEHPVLPRLFLSLLNPFLWFKCRLKFCRSSF